MRPAGYIIKDEPAPSGLSQWTVNPVWPLLAVMFAGPWLSWPWFLFNAVAQGAPEKGKDIALVTAGAIVKVGIVFGLLYLIAVGKFPAWWKPYAPLVSTLWVLFLSYVLFLRQQRTFSLYEYFGGPVRNGAWVVLAGFLVGRRILAAFPEMLQLVLR